MIYKQIAVIKYLVKISLNWLVKQGKVTKFAIEKYKLELYIE